MLLKTIATLTAQAVATVTANYATSAAIDAYCSPDLKDCKSDEDRQKKTEDFNKIKKVAKVGCNVIEAAAIGKVSMMVLNSNKSSTSSTDSESTSSDDASTAMNRGYLVGKNFLVHNI